MNRNVLITISSDEEGDNPEPSQDSKKETSSLKVSEKLLPVKITSLPINREAPDWIAKELKKKGTTINRKEPSHGLKTRKSTPVHLVGQNHHASFFQSKKKNSASIQSTPEVVDLAADDNISKLPTIIDVKSMATGYSKKYVNFNKDVFELMDRNNKPSRSSTTLFPSIPKRSNDESSRQPQKKIKSVIDSEEGSWQNPFAQKSKPVPNGHHEVLGQITPMMKKQIYGLPNSRIDDVIDSIEACASLFKSSESSNLVLNSNVKPNHFTNETQVVDKSNQKADEINDVVVCDDREPGEVQICEEKMETNDSISEDKNEIQVCEKISTEAKQTDVSKEKCEIENGPEEGGGAKQKLSQSEENNSNKEKLEESKNEGSEGESKTTYEIYQEFIDMLSSIEKGEKDRKRIIEKLNKHYNSANPKYTRSPEFRSLLEKCTSQLKKDKILVYFLVREIIDNLKSRRALKPAKKRVALTSVDLKGDDENYNPAFKKAEKAKKVGEVELLEDGKEEKEIKEDISHDPKREKTIRKLSRTLSLLDKKIRQLEEEEVDLNDDYDSNYFKMQRYRDRFCKVHQKICEYTGESSNAGRVLNRRIHFSGTKFPAVNQCIEKWLNKTKQFPDFMDILKLVEEQSVSLGLNSTTEDLRRIATDAFREVGQMLQRMRIFDLWDSYSSYLENHRDPAQEDPELEKVLCENYERCSKKEKEIIDSFAEKQNKLKLEPMEVPEDEANCSPVETSDEDEKEIEEFEKSLDEALEDISGDERQNKELKKNGKDKDSVEALAEEEEEEEEEATTNDDMNPSPSLLDSSKTSDLHNPVTPVKESKNNYKNCKSIKWRGESKIKSVGENKLKETSCDSEDTPQNTNIEMIEISGKVSNVNGKLEENKVTEEIEPNEDATDKSNFSNLTEEAHSPQKLENCTSTQENHSGKDALESKVDDPKQKTEDLKEDNHSPIINQIKEKGNEEEQEFSGDDFIPGSQEAEDIKNEDNVTKKRKSIFENFKSKRQKNKDKEQSLDSNNRNSPLKSPPNKSVKDLSDTESKKNREIVEKENDENAINDKEERQKVFHVNYVQVKHNSKGFLHNYYSLPETIYSKNLKLKKRQKFRSKHAFQDLTNIQGIFQSNRCDKTLLNAANQFTTSLLPPGKFIKNFRVSKVNSFEKEIGFGKHLFWEKSKCSPNLIKGFSTSLKKFEINRCTLDNENVTTQGEGRANSDEKSQESSNGSYDNFSNRENNEQAKEIGGGSGDDRDNNDNDDSDRSNRNIEDETEEGENEEDEEKEEKDEDKTDKEDNEAQGLKEGGDSSNVNDCTGDLKTGEISHITEQDILTKESAVNDDGEAECNNQREEEEEEEVTKKGDPSERPEECGELENEEMTENPNKHCLTTPHNDETCGDDDDLVGSEKTGEVEEDEENTIEEQREGTCDEAEAEAEANDLENEVFNQTTDVESNDEDDELKETLGEVEEMEKSETNIPTFEECDDHLDSTTNKKDATEVGDHDLVEETEEEKDSSSEKESAVHEEEEPEEAIEKKEVIESKSIKMDEDMKENEAEETETKENKDDKTDENDSMSLKNEDEFEEDKIEEGNEGQDVKEEFDDDDDDDAVVKEELDDEDGAVVKEEIGEGKVVKGEVGDTTDSNEEMDVKGEVDDGVDVKEEIDESEDVKGEVGNDADIKEGVDENEDVKGEIDESEEVTEKGHEEEEEEETLEAEAEAAAANEEELEVPEEKEVEDSSIENGNEGPSEAEETVAITNEKTSKTTIRFECNEKNPVKLRQSITAFRNRAGTSSEVEFIVEKKKKRDESDEEIVKKFLQHSPSSISITLPRKSTMSKPPSEAALQALATLRRLKNISTTRVQRSAKRSPEDDVVVLSETMSSRKKTCVPPNRSRANSSYGNQSALPVISSVQSINNRLTPKIVTVQGNVSGFNNRMQQVPRFNHRVSNVPNYNIRMPMQQQTAFRISNVRGNLTNSFNQSSLQPRVFRNPMRQSMPSSSAAPRGKSKKTVECVVLD